MENQSSLKYFIIQLDKGHKQCLIKVQKKVLLAVRTGFFNVLYRLIISPK